MLRLILAVSADGYLSRGPHDDMEWTGSPDKKVFRLLTSVGGVCAAGSTTWAHMPELPGRRVVPISRCLAVQHRMGHSEHAMSLGTFAHRFPNGWLLGGPTVAMDALDCGLVDQVYLCRSPVVLFESQGAFSPMGQRDQVSPWLMSRGESINAGVPWRRDHRIQLDGVTVDCWSRRDRPQP